MASIVIRKQTCLRPLAHWLLKLGCCHFIIKTTDLKIMTQQDSKLLWQRGHGIGEVGEWRTSLLDKNLDSW